MKVKIGKYPKWRWFNNWLYEKTGYRPEQSVKVKIDPWDTWSFDCTLAEIVYPALMQLAKDKHGSPQVDNADVPEELRHDGDKYIHERWDYVMSEMIYAFEQKVNDWEEKLWEHKSFEDGSDEWVENRIRIANGFRLFGKYFESLWS